MRITTTKPRILTRADITLPRADKDKLIFVASFSRSPYNNK